MTNKQIVNKANYIIQTDKEKLIEIVLKNNQTKQTAIRAVAKEFSVSQKVADLILSANLNDFCSGAKVNFWNYLYTYQKGIKAYKHIVKSGMLNKINIRFVKNNIDLLTHNPMDIIHLIDSLFYKSDFKLRDKILNKVYLSAFKLS